LAVRPPPVGRLEGVVREAVRGTVAGVATSCPRGAAAAGMAAQG
jgi:hypothetical protein